MIVGKAVTESFSHSWALKLKLLLPHFVDALSWCDLCTQDSLVHTPVLATLGSPGMTARHCTRLVGECRNLFAVLFLL